MSDEAQDTEAKPIWQSRTIIGAAVTIFALVAGFKNFKVDVANLTDILVQVAGLIGAALAIYGRIKATKPITFTAGTTPGGAFNPSAPVKKAEPVNAGGTPTLRCRRLSVESRWRSGCRWCRSLTAGHSSRGSLPAFARRRARR